MWIYEPADKANFQSVVNSIEKQLQIHELDTSYNIVYLNAMGISYTADSGDANDTGFSFMAAAGVLVAFLILLAAGLVIYNILKISVSKRIKGYGTLRAIGGEKGPALSNRCDCKLFCCVWSVFLVGMLLGSFSASGILAAATGLVSSGTLFSSKHFGASGADCRKQLSEGAFVWLSAVQLLWHLRCFAALPAARSAAKVSPITAMSGYEHENSPQKTES